MRRITFRLSMIALVFVMAACGGRQPSAGRVLTATLYCPDCQAESMPANLWRTRQMNSLACRAEWGERVTILAAEGVMRNVQTDSGCTGWIKSSLLR